MNEKPHIFLIVVDTLREDYSYLLERELKRYGFITYNNAIAPAPWTLPSHASLFTGLLPSYHGAHETKKRKVPHIKLKAETSYYLPTILSNIGYRTYLITANAFILPEFGFSDFEYIYCTPSISSKLTKKEKERILEIKKKYNPKSKMQYLKSLLKEKELNLLAKVVINSFSIEFQKRRLNWPKDKGATQIIKRIDNIKFNQSHPSFIFINLMEVHEPYPSDGNPIKNPIHLISGQVDQKTVKIWKQDYPGQVEYVAKKLREMLEILQDKNLLDNSLIIITSDHGQLLGEHGGKLSHGVFLYDELIKVPLFIKYPSNSNVKILDYENYQYIPLINLKYLILDVIKNNTTKDEILYSNFAMSESFGTQYGISSTNTIDTGLFESLEMFRVAIYYKDVKGVFNVATWEFEEIKKYSNSDVTREDVKALKSFITKHLSTIASIKVASRKLGGAKN
ncbi:sulfatase-like hydrolase/transferase [Thermococcus sp. GR4]|uniref:sulfatase-like hydrolase/transferase n=1 Tax=Thermococcus sp. GR4 TaxID=1638254 RepID=UPI00143059C7|nr:sulfatase-like hydrolase/transferase [Thermococcus sp. GR4]NJE79463.1 hypothetical protein [Thermococcus sp. GR4]